MAVQAQGAPTPTLQTIDAVLEKANAVMELNKLLREALENATKSLLNVSVATEEQISLVVEFTKEEAQNVTLQGGVVIPNAVKLIAELREKIQDLFTTSSSDYDALKERIRQDVEASFNAFVALKTTEAQEFKDDATQKFNALMQSLESQKQAQAQKYEEIKKEIEFKLGLINTSAFLNEFAELKVNMEANLQKINRVLSNHALFVTEQNANNALVMQKIFTLIKGQQ